MKMRLLLLCLTTATISCGIFLGENPRSFKYKMESGEILGFSVSENRFPLTEIRKVIVKSAGNYPLKGRDCEDSELEEFGNDVWSEFVKSDELAGINSAALMLEKEKVQGTPKYCQYNYSRKDNGEWIQD